MYQLWRMVCLLGCSLWLMSMPVIGAVVPYNGEWTATNKPAANLSGDKWAFTVAADRTKITKIGFENITCYGVSIQNPTDVNINTSKFDYSFSHGSEYGLVTIKVDGTFTTANQAIGNLNISIIGGYDCKAEWTATGRDHTASTVATVDATAVTAITATLKGTVTSNDFVVTAIKFKYGIKEASLDKSIDGNPDTVPASSPATSVTATATATGLTCGTNYEFEITATSNSNITINGGKKSFTTSACTVNLTVKSDPTAGGSVTSQPACTGNACPFPKDTQITLTATPNTGYEFQTWEGKDCAGTTNPCTFKITQDTTVTAKFKSSVTPQLKLKVKLSHNGVNAGGSVTSNPPQDGINCPSDSNCERLFDTDTRIILEARGTNVKFGGWIGCPDVSKSTLLGKCDFKLTQNKEVTAIFTKLDNADYFTLKIDPKPTNGKIISKDQLLSTGGPSINCGKDGSVCNPKYYKDAVVTLTGNAANSGDQVQWGNGDCKDVAKGTDCVLTMNSDKTVSASFVPGGAATTKKLTVQVNDSGSGSTVTSSPEGISCTKETTSSCSKDFASGTAITLTSKHGAGSTFTGWAKVSGDTCTPNSATCAIAKLNNDTIVKATFTTGQATTHTLTVTKPINGKIEDVVTINTTTNVGQNVKCGSGSGNDKCSYPVSKGTTIRLLVTANTKFKPNGWTGCDSPGADVSDYDKSAYCNIKVDTDKTVNVKFEAVEEAFLESPVVSSKESGMGLIRGWACENAVPQITGIQVVIDGKEKDATYPTKRNDTKINCGNKESNGFAYLYNWNNLTTANDPLSVAKQVKIVLVRGSSKTDLAEVKNFTATSLGNAGTSAQPNYYWNEVNYNKNTSITVPDFPAKGQSTSLKWSIPHQNFVIVPTTTPSPVTGGFVEKPKEFPAFLESPTQNSFESGVGLIRGWACKQIDTRPTGITAVKVEIYQKDNNSNVADRSYELPVKTKRTETVGANTTCKGNVNNGFALVFPWYSLGSGQHKLKAFVMKGSVVETTPFAEVTFNVTTLKNAAGGDDVSYKLPETLPSTKVVVDKFPTDGKTTTLQWATPHQNFVITEVK